MYNSLNSCADWLIKQYQVDIPLIIEALQKSPSAQGYIHGALSELLLIDYLTKKDYEVFRIKEKPAGGFDEKKPGYKGDFLIKKANTTKYYVVECKGLKTNSEFRGAETDEDDHIKKLTRKQAYNLIVKYINIDKNAIYDKGYNRYCKKKETWEKNHPGKEFPAFRWSHDFPGPDSVDLSPYFSNKKEIKELVYNCDESLLYETSFRENKGLYRILQTHEPSTRTDNTTGIKSAAPLVTDFSMMAVDLFQRTGRHEFVFMNPDEIAHSPDSPNHLYQNYTIDIIIPGIKDSIVISRPWYRDIDDCINTTSPRTVKYDESQLDYR